jgi:hypothetical protein
MYSGIPGVALFLCPKPGHSLNQFLGTPSKLGVSAVNTVPMSAVLAEGEEPEVCTKAVHSTT